MKFAVGEPVVIDLTGGSTRDGDEKSLRGVVAHVGPVDFSPDDDWVGVRLVDEDVGLGRNDGVVRGKRYFTASPLGGVFVRRKYVASWITNDDYHEEYYDDDYEEEEESRAPSIFSTPTLPPSVVEVKVNSSWDDRRCLLSSDSVTDVSALGDVSDVASSSTPGRCLPSLPNLTKEIERVRRRLEEAQAARSSGSSRRRLQRGGGGGGGGEDRRRERHRRERRATLDDEDEEYEEGATTTTREENLRLSRDIGRLQAQNEHLAERNTASQLKQSSMQLVIDELRRELDDLQRRQRPKTSGKRRPRRSTRGDAAAAAANANKTPSRRRSSRDDGGAAALSCSRRPPSLSLLSILPCSSLANTCVSKERSGRGFASLDDAAAATEEEEEERPRSSSSSRTAGPRDDVASDDEVFEQELRVVASELLRIKRLYRISSEQNERLRSTLEQVRDWRIDALEVHNEQDEDEASR